MSVASVISCIVGIISCIVGVSTFTSAQITKAKQDGVLIEKIDQCVKGIEELKLDTKQRNRDIDNVLDEHTKEIAALKEQVKTLLKSK